MSKLQNLLNTNNYITDKGLFPDSSKHYNTTNCNLHNYISIYDEMFSPYIDKSINLLEIGILDGGSIKLWRDYFTNAKIFGVDIDYNQKARQTLKDLDVKIEIADSIDKNSEFLKSIPDEYFDIIIEDGNHSFEYQYKTLINYLPKLKKGGLYIIEDVESNTLNNQICINAFNKIHHFKTIDLRNIDKRDDSVLFVFQKNNSVNFISFYSQGPPYDTGIDFSTVENNVRQAVSPHVDNFTAYHLKELRDDPEFSWSVKDWSAFNEKYSRPELGWWSPKSNKYVDINKGCDKTGFFAWKATCILKKFREIDYGDIVYYHDGNFDKEVNYPFFKKPFYEGIEHWKNICNIILNDINCDIFIPWEQNSGLQPIRNFCKKYCFDKLAEYNDYYTKYDCLWAGLIIMRKSDLSIKFLNDVIEALKDVDLISNVPEDNSNELMWHTWDQPIWTIMARKYIKNNLFPENWPKYFIKDRVFTPNFLIQSNHTR